MTTDKRYVKFPTCFIEFIMTTKFPEYQSKMLLAAVRNCHGYHEPERRFDIVDLVRWLRWDRRSVYRAVGELLQRNIFRRDKDGKYLINGLCDEWVPETPKAHVDKSVDNPVDNSKQLVLQSTLDYRSSGNPLPLTAHLSTAFDGSTNAEESEVKPPTEKENLPAASAQVIDAAEFLKNSLKKILKKKENSDSDSDVLKNASEKKKKLEVYKLMVRSGRWNDDELLDLAKQSSAEQLEAVYYSALPLRNTG